jgi:hypothetical protein
MSRPFNHRQIVACPFGIAHQKPIHVGHGVMICETCGQYFRVVMARGKNTGVKLAREIGKAVTWK